MTLYRTASQAGYTLIELLLYVSIVGGLLISITYFFAMAAESRVKNQAIAEVNDQGATVMDTMLQTIRNATSITAPATGTSSPTSTLVVPTGALSPTIFNVSGTVFGYNADGGITDTSDSNTMNATKIVAASTGTISMLYAYIGPTVAASPNNKAQMAIYSGAASPTTLLASSANVTLMAGTWNTFTIPSVTVTSGQTYWLAYNTNGLAAGDNDLRKRAGAAGQSQFTAQAFGTWAASWTGAAQAVEFSMFAMIDAAGTPGALQIKEGAGSIVPLVNSKVRLSGLVFRNLTKAGTGGTVQVTFNLARVNPENRNEYDYQQTFTSSAEVSW
ncbi:MAG TPA: hypothetical protein VGO07_01525 [Candidatus Saccharimonadales bacterium]|jgi:hypothetical protein|nr:hypothetical protein [Candidatus Saccharimonadales bacterium]